MVSLDSSVLVSCGGIVYDLIWEEKELIASFRVAAATVPPQMVQTNDLAHPDSLVLATK